MSESESSSSTGDLDPLGDSKLTGEVDPRTARNSEQVFSCVPSTSVFERGTSAPSPEPTQTALPDLIQARDRLAAFDAMLHRANSDSTLGAVDTDLVHELRGALNAIVLQVEAIKQSLEHDDPNEARELDALEHGLRRSRHALKTFLVESVPSTPIEKAFSRPS